MQWADSIAAWLDSLWGDSSSGAQAAASCCQALQMPQPHVRLCSTLGEGSIHLAECTPVVTQLHPAWRGWLQPPSGK